MKHFSEDNRGLTLIELLVSLTVLSVVMGAIFSFLIICSHQYTRGGNESSLQNEAQLLIARMENLIVGATDSIETDGEKITIKNHTEDGSGVIKEKQTIEIKRDGNQIKYQKTTTSIQADGSDGPSTTSAWFTLSEFIKDSPDGMKVAADKDKGTITVVYTMENKDKSYETENTFIPRNKIKILP